MRPITQAIRWSMGLLVAFSLVNLNSGHAKTFSRCQLSRELLRYNFPRSLIPTWVCIIEHESNSRTDHIFHHNNGHTGYGLFQINSKEWCKKGRKGGHCNMKCEELLNVDLSDDVRCAKRIYDRVGFAGWPAWASRCRGKQLPDLSRC